MTCAYCFREMAHVRVDLGTELKVYVHRRCLEGWAAEESDGVWFSDGQILWCSNLRGNFARIVRGRGGRFWFQIFNSNGVQEHGSSYDILKCQYMAERLMQ